ncbi:P-loop containing nucleoside triphosphate hydrolase protein, partial [Pavlovales sp. CCMP2436]
GVIPRALGLLFQKAEEAKTAGWAFEFEASLLEVYNEELRDLLPDSTGPAPPTSGLALQHGLKSDATTLLAKATAARTTAKTSCNEHSSRSHSICVLRVSGFHQESGERVRGCLSLVDLAGSERIKESGVSGARLKEAQSINKSLSALGDVIAALAAKEKHIPFRNSKLTSLLQPSLGGASKALMVVNVAADPSNWNESLCSLRFAQKVSGV